MSRSTEKRDYRFLDHWRQGKYDSSVECQDVSTFENITWTSRTGHSNVLLPCADESMCVSVQGLAFRRNSHQLFSSSQDRSVKLWNIDEMTYVETLSVEQFRTEHRTNVAILLDSVIRNPYKPSMPSCASAASLPVAVMDPYGYGKSSKNHI